jgi:hypothetical protein
MPGPAPSLMFEHCLNHPKGWFEPAALDYDAKLSSNVSIIAYGGRVVHLNAAGEFEMGVSGTKMPIFLLQADTDFDVSNPGTTPAGNFMQQPISPTGKMSGLVATGGYELESTEHDTTPTVAYAPNQLLTAKAVNNVQATAGVLSNDRAGANGSTGPVRQYVDAACGVVARGQFKNEHNVFVLSFWPVYLPAAA